MTSIIPAVPNYVFHAYLLHGMIRIARFFAPEVQPWQENDSSADFQFSKDAIQRYLRIYLGSSLYQLSSEDLEGLIIAAGEQPEQTSDLVSQLIQSMADNFWDWGDAPWIKHGIFMGSPQKDMIPCSFGAIVFEAICCLIYNFQIAYAYDLSLTIEMHAHHGNFKPSQGPIISWIKDTFKDTFSREYLIFAQVGANELSNFYKQSSLFDEESNAWRYSFVLQMALDRILNYEEM